MKKILLASLAALMTASSLLADEITDTLATAKSAYDAGNYTEALQSLDYAGQLLRQKKGDSVMKLLPEAPKGWTAEEAESESAGATLMGGMVSVKRHYTKGDSSVTVQVQSDSPILQSMAMMFSNPMLMSGNGAKLETIKGQRVAVSYRKDDKAGDIKALVDNRYLVSIEGNDVAREDLVAFANALDFGALGKLK